MSREIKFRAWDKKNGYMMPVESIDFNTRIINYDGVWRFFDELYLMQYTGLKDKNGVEIYEGDIYRYKYYFDSKRYEYHHIIVEWDTTDIIYEGVFHGYELNECCIEVVGNIYENLELLKEL